MVMEAVITTQLQRLEDTLWPPPGSQAVTPARDDLSLLPPAWGPASKVLADRRIQLETPACSFVKANMCLTNDGSYF